MSRPVPADETDTAAAVAPRQPPGLMVSLRDLWRGMSPRVHPQAPADGFGWPALLAVVVAAGWLVNVGRVLLGLVAVDRLGRQSRPLNDEPLLRLLSELQHRLRLYRSIDLRETDQLGTAATVGWRRPLILLPAGWRSWSAGELRAVLAHELAHIRRGDFALGLAARLGAVEPFELMGLPEDAHGVLMLRPSVLFGRPDMKKVTDFLNKNLPGALKCLGLDGELAGSLCARPAKAGTPTQPCHANPRMALALGADSFSAPRGLY